MRLRLAIANGRDGQVLPIFAIFLVVLLGFAALTVDYGSWLKVRRDYQNAADAAALAGSGFLTRPISESKRTAARRAAWESLKTQLDLGIDPAALDDSNSSAAGELDAATGYRLWVSTPPIGAGAAYIGAYTSSTSRHLWVQVQKSNQAFFSRVLGMGDPMITAFATAGSFAGKFAVITLRQESQAGPSDAEDILIAGNNSGLEVIGGDVGGNWGMKLNANSHLWIRGVADNDADTHLIDYVSCGSACWNLGQVSSGPNGSPANETNEPEALPAPVEDPNYALPTVLSTAPAGPVAAVPLGDIGGVIDVKNGGPDRAPGGTTTTGGILGCDAASPRIGPGYYTSIRVRSGQCLILDPTQRHSSITAAVPDVPSLLASGQLPGIFYINGDIDVDSNAMVVGDGVTLILRPSTSSPDNQLIASSGGVVSLNRGVITPNRQRGAWTVKAASTYTCDAVMNCTYNTALNADIEQTGIAIYVVKPRQINPSAAIDANTDVIKINAGAGLAWTGVTYAPQDNITLAGQPGHDGIGQLVSWTFKFAGGVNVKQTYDGPDTTTPRLVEPTLGQP